MDVENAVTAYNKIIKKLLALQTITANFVQTRYKYGKMKKIKEVNKAWQHIR